MSDALNKKLDAYYQAREAYDIAKANSDRQDAFRREKERELVDFMIENKFPKIARDDGSTTMLVKAVTCSVTQENYDDIREWLRQTYGDETDFLVTIPHKPAILEAVKKSIESGTDSSDFPAFLRVDTRPTLRVDGWKTRVPQ